MPELSENEVIEKLKQIDTPTISNVVATYPKSDICLKLYDAWHGQYYTDTTVKCMFPEFEPRVGYVATVTFCEASEKYTGVGRWKLPEHIEETKKPVVLVAEQRFPINLANRVGLFGDSMVCRVSSCSLIRSLKVVSLINLL